MPDMTPEARIAETLAPIVGIAAANECAAVLANHPNIAIIERCEPCSGTGTVECWNPGGPCEHPNDPQCDTCGPCNLCADRAAGSDT